MHGEVKKANDAFEKEEFALAASRYESLSDRYPKSPVRERLMFNQGMSLYKVNSFHDARDIFHQYLGEFPDGEHVPEVREYLRKVDVYMSMDSPALQEAVEAAKADPNKLIQLQVQHPNDPKIFYALATCITRWVTIM